MAAFIAAFGAGIVSGRAIAQTADWSAVSVGCVPDDTATTPSRYDADPSGRIKFEGTTAIGDLFFWCNVVSPIEPRGVNPTWNTLVLANRDINENGFVQAVLYRKVKSTGVSMAIATVNSGNSGVIKEDSVAIATAFDFATYAYFVRVQLHRDVNTTNPEFHGVSLKELP
jgi:hypothetical protein